MNKVIKLGAMITLSISTLAGCGNNSSPTTGTFANSAFATRADATRAAGFKPGAMNGFKGIKGGPGDFGMGIFNLPAELNLTADQKTQFEAIDKADKPAQPDKATIDANKTAMDAVRKEINDAFISDTFDATALKAKLDALKPAKPNNDDRITAQANRIIKTYNILTPDQRTILETKQQEIFNAVPKTMPSPPANFDPSKMADNRIDKLATDLGLSDTQKASLKTVLQPPANPVKPDFQAELAKRKAMVDAINAELKTGNASVDKIVSILKANAPTDIKPQDGSELDRLAKIHDILNADQRKKFIDTYKGFGFGGPGGFGGHGHGRGGFGGGHGFPGGPGGFGRHGGPGRK